MDPRQTITEYIRPSQKRKTTLLALGILASVLIAAGACLCFLSSLSTIGGIVLLIGVFVAAVWACLFPAYSAAMKNMKYTLSRIEELGLVESAAAELTGEEKFVVCDDRSRLTPNFAFRHHGGVVVTYEDIVWFMIYPGRSQDIEITANIKTGRSFQPVSLTNKNSNYDEIHRAYSYISEHCPNAMEGFSTENAKAYRDAVKQYKATKKK